MAHRAGRVAAAQSGGASRSWVDRLRSPAMVTVACLVALGLRLHRLPEALPRWDEGWSIAHASRSLVEVVEIASWEVHPPLFYLTVKPWLCLGRSLFFVRALPVLVGVLAVPAAYRAAKTWFERRSVGLLAALLTAFAPGLVYYAQVLRMYPFAAVLLLLAIWAYARWLRGGSTWSLVALWTAGTAALYTFYYSAFAVASLFAYGLLFKRRRLGLAITSLLVALGFMPWLLYAGPGLVQRMVEAAPVETIMPVTAWDLVSSTWTALTFDFASGGWAAAVVLVLVLVALPICRDERGSGVSLLMPLVGLLATSAGVAFGSGFYFFAPRLLTPAVPFLVLLLSRSLDTLGRRSWVFLAVAAVLLGVAYWPTATQFVYEKGLEVSGEYDPHEYHRTLAASAEADDLVFFNQLALAGWYELDRGPDDANWSYALRWTPIVEPMSRIKPRVAQAAEAYPRLWFVLYKGSFGPSWELKKWLDANLFPVTMVWGRDSLFLSYVPPADAMRHLAPQADFGGLVELPRAVYAVGAGSAGQVPIELTWRALDGPLPDLRIVVQAWDETGKVLAQRDVRPANWELPSYEWGRQDLVVDRHALVLGEPSNTPVHLAVSVYDAETGRALPVDGRPFLELGTVADGRSG